MSVVKPDAGRTLLFTESGFVWSFPTENFITLGIRGLITGLATLGDALLAFSLEEVWAVTGNDPASFLARRVDGATPGAFSQEAILEWQGGVYYVGFDGVYRIDSSYNVTRVSDAIRDVFLALTSSSSVAVAVDRSRGILYFALAGPVFSFDPATGAWGKAGFTATTLESGLNLIRGDGTTVSFLDDATTARSVSFTTEYLDLGQPDATKRFRRASIAFDNPTGATGSCVLTPVRADGTSAAALASQVIPAGRSVLTWNLPGLALVGRGIALSVAITGRPGLTVQPPIEIEYELVRGRAR